MPTPIKLDEEKLFFTHTTGVLPRNGVMIPGHPEMIVDYVPFKAGAEQARMTLHWYPQNICEEHYVWSLKNKDFVIIEKASKIKPYIYGGYCKDIMTLGSYQLSNESIICVPETKLDFAKEILGPSFAGKFISYKSLADLTRIIDAEKKGYVLDIPPNMMRLDSLRSNTLF